MSTSNGRARLVLTRKLYETVLIGDEVEVTVVDIRSDKIRLSITAPRSVPVHRREVYEAIRRKRRVAAGTLDAMPSTRSA